MHVGELVGEDNSDYDLVVGIVGEVHEDVVGVGVGVLCRVYPCEVMAFDEGWAKRH